MISIWLTIRTRCHEKGMTLRALATELDITPTYLTMICKDQKIPSLQLLQDIADVLDLRLHISLTNR